MAFRSELEGMRAQLESMRAVSASDRRELKTALEERDVSLAEVERLRARLDELGAAELEAEATTERALEPPLAESAATSPNPKKSPHRFRRMGVPFGIVLLLIPLYYLKCGPKNLVEDLAGLQLGMSESEARALSVNHGVGSLRDRGATEPDVLLLGEPGSCGWSGDPVNIVSCNITVGTGTISDGLTRRVVHELEDHMGWPDDNSGRFWYNETWEWRSGRRHVQLRRYYELLTIQLVDNDAASALERHREAERVRAESNERTQAEAAARERREDTRRRLGMGTP